MRRMTEAEMAEHGVEAAHWFNDEKDDTKFHPPWINDDLYRDRVFVTNDACVVIVADKRLALSRDFTVSVARRMCYEIGELVRRGWEPEDFVDLLGFHVLD